MKRLPKLLLIITLLLTLGSVVSAEEPTPEEDPCLNDYIVAENIMTYRQRNEPFPEYIKRLNLSPHQIKYVTPILIKAYSEPLWAVAENKNEAVRSFANAAYMHCFQSRHKQNSK